ncbi:MAG: hypothetical protein IJ306_03520 [Oscillospiraceae bacterium]|nr:hypothetical protein [Oscillospiraceae bacterium]
MPKSIFVIMIFVAAIIIIGGAGFLIEAAACKSAKNKWAKIIPAGCALCWFLSMLLIENFFFYDVAVGLLFAGMAAALLVDFLKRKRITEE